MMPVGFTVGGDIDQTRCFCASLREAIYQHFARGQNLLEGYIVGQFSIIKEHRDRSSGAIAMEIAVGSTRIDGVATDRMPFTSEDRIAADPLGLLRGENNKTQSFIDQHTEHVIV